MANIDVHFSSARLGDKSKDEWETPPELFKRLNEVHNFTLDAAASKGNSLCESFFTIEDNALEKKWRGIVFMNPPYSKLADFCRKAYNEVLAGNCEKVVALLPARVDTKIFHECMYEDPYARVEFLKGRLKFWKEGNPKPNSAPFPSMIVTWAKKF